jgi:4-carboxymuconolactone decarboxylase
MPRAELRKREIRLNGRDCHLRKILLTIVTATLFASPAPAQQASPPSTSSDSQARATPALASYTKDLLFGEVWKRPGLSPRDRSLVVVSALIATGGNAARMRSHFNLALQNGLKPSELSALITHQAFYSGWPNAVGAAEVAAEIFEQRGIPASSVQPSKDLLPAAKGSGSLDPASTKAADLAPALATYGRDIINGGLWRIADLSPRDRSLSTIVALAATGNRTLLAEEVNRGIANGLSRAELSEAVVQLAFYVGWPTAVGAAAAIDDILTPNNASSTAGMAPLAKSLRIVRNGAEPRQGEASHFSGQAVVRTPFFADEPAKFRGSTVTFAAGARTAWHAHERGQMLIIISGRGYVQAEGGPVEEVGPGDVIWTPAGVRHWHGATRKGPMSHTAVSEGGTVTWGEQVADPLP